jgi:hypothetical protein
MADMRRCTCGHSESEHVGCPCPQFGAGPTWAVRIRYSSPGPAGPTVGTVYSTDGWMRGRECPKRGDMIRGMFGQAVVTSIKRTPTTGG